MTDEELIELTDIEETAVSIIWQAFPEYFDGAVEGQNYGDAAKLDRLARDLSKHFVEQACEVASIFLMTKTQLDVEKIVDLEQAIREKFSE